MNDAAHPSPREETSPATLGRSVAGWAALGLAIGVAVPWPLLGALLGGGYGFVRAKRP